MSVMLLFICDAMLGRVCRWLRLLGYEADYEPDESDDTLLMKAEKLKGILLTRDQQLYMRAKREGVEAFYVEGDDFYSQLSSIVLKFKLRLQVDPSISHCPKCGGKIVSVAKESVAGVVPRTTLKRHNEFWVCEKCGKVYWKGGMWKSMLRVVEKIKERSGGGY